MFLLYTLIVYNTGNKGCYYYYHRCCCWFRRGADDAGLMLLRSLQSVEFDVEEMRRQEKELPAADGTFRGIFRGGAFAPHSPFAGEINLY